MNERERIRIHGPLQPMIQPDPRKGTIRLTLLLIVLFVLLLTVGSEVVRAIVWGVPA